MCSFNDFLSLQIKEELMNTSIKTFDDLSYFEKEVFEKNRHIRQVAAEAMLLKVEKIRVGKLSNKNIDGLLLFNKEV